MNLKQTMCHRRKLYQKLKSQLLISWSLHDIIFYVGYMLILKVDKESVEDDPVVLTMDRYQLRHVPKNCHRYRLSWLLIGAFGDVIYCLCRALSQYVKLLSYFERLDQGEIKYRQYTSIKSTEAALV